MVYRFQTVADELQECAAYIAAFFRQRTYAVTIEPSKLGYPSVPTLSAKRKQTTILVEIGRRAKLQLFEQWVAYGKSTGKDTRIAFASDRQPSAKEFRFLKEKGIGFYLDQQGSVVEQLVAQDLGINLALPPLNTLSPSLRKKFIHVYEKIEKAFWVEAFEDACKVLEEESAGYLVEFSVSGRIKVMGKSGPVTLSKEEIEKLTMGKLAGAYRRVVAPTTVDTQIYDALSRVNRDRNRVTHQKNEKVTTESLRKNVGQHMWIIIGALKLIC